MLKFRCFPQAAAFAALVTVLFTLSARANPLYRVTNVSPSPALTNEFYLTATNILANINGTNVHALIYADDPPGGGGAPHQIPGPFIELNVGQMVVCHFKNNLTNNIEGASIHWHGIELDNDSDGTPITQDTILPGQTYTYRFLVPRAGLFWYHSHMLPGTTTFGGMYGAIVVHDTNEAALIAANILPSTNNTFPLLLTDVDFTNGVIGKVIMGTNYSLNTLIQLCENSVLGVGSTLSGSCGAAGIPGSIFLCNGSVPHLSGTICAPSSNSAPVFFIGKNQRIRLQLFNDSISRNSYLALHYPCSNPTGDTNLYHIGGQGGLLDNAVLDGGVQAGYDFQYIGGTVNLGSGMRSDVMFYSSGNNGDVIQLVGNSLPAQWKLSKGDYLGTNYPVAFFVITNGGATNLPLAAGSPILSAIGASVDNLQVLNTNLLAPPPNVSLGAQTGVLQFKNGTPINGTGTGPSIGDYAATALDGNSGFGSWPYVPHPPTALWARAGDVLQLAIANNTGNGGDGGAVHPFHLHGFSMQPVSIYTSDLQTNLFNFPFHQFVDTLDIYPGEALVFRIKLTDRPIFADSATGGPLTLATDSPTGGAVGRWLMHCHIFLHGAIGMISELNVLPNSTTRLVGSAAGTNSVILPGATGVVWSVTADSPWLHVLSPASGNASTTVLFSYDANPGATRVGNLNVDGETVTVTQAGTTYVKAPAPVTTLAASLSGPVGIAADGDGNVYFCDGGHGAIKRWNPSNNTVTTLASGFGNLQGLGLDGLGNVYFADFNSIFIRMWSASTHTVSTVFNDTSTGISGLAVDNAGNVYFTVPSQGVVKKYTALTGSISTYTTNGLNAPYAVAVDTAGNVYVADTADNAVKKLGLTVIFFLGHPIFVPNWNTVVTSTDLNTPWNLAVDDGGNIYIADGGHSAIKRFNYVSNTVDTLVSSGLGDPTGVTVDGGGNVYISDFNNGAVKELPYAYLDPTPKHEPAEITVDTLPVVLPPTQNLLPPFAPTPNQSWVFYGGAPSGIVKFLVGANVGGPRAGSLTVLGQPVTINQDGASGGVGTTSLLVGPAAGSNTVTEFVIPSIATWSAGTATPWLHLPVTSGTGSGNVLFTYDQNFGPTRMGTITINGKSVTVTQAGSTYVQAPGPLTTLVGSGLASPVDVAVDSIGNVVFSDSGNNTVKQWSPGSLTASTIVSSGISTPQSVGVDAAGNIYIADFYGEAIKEWRASDSNLLTLVDCSPLHPSGLSLGFSTNIYWSSPAISTVYEWLAATSNSVAIVSNTLNGPYGLAVDVAGAIYIADTYNNAIKKWDPAASLLTTLGTAGLNDPWNVAVDGSGNVYVANGNSNNIVEWVAASGSFVTLVPGGLSTPTGVSVDAGQNVYIADFGHSAVKELPYAFIDPSARFEPAGAGSDSLSVVFPPSQNLLAQFAPTVSQPWLNIAGTAGGVVSFNFTANTNILARAASITLLGQNIVINQAAAVYPPLLINPSMPTNGVFQFGFTGGTRGATYSVLFSTNLTTPLTNWTVIGAASQVGPNLWQFTDSQASNLTRFYVVRSP